MKISVHAVGRMKAGPEKLLADRYFERFAKSGPALGLEFGGIAEIAEGRSQTANERRREEGQKLQTQ
ncbi:MAG: 23S rRNA (pseudouridine(1915)-N(3))-methyltransferase RlmH, partial [Mesorhizobium sp.]